MAIVLKTKHIIMLSKLVAKLDIKLDLTEKDPTKLGGKIIMDMLSNIYIAEDELYELLASLVDATPAKVADMPIEDIFAELSEVVNAIINFIHKSAKSTA